MLGDRIAELRRSPIWGDTTCAGASEPLQQALAVPMGSTALDQSMKSIVPDSRVVATGVTPDGRAWERWDTGATAYEVPNPVLDVQELPPLSRAQLQAAAAAPSAAAYSGTNAAFVGITPAQVDASIAAGNTGVLDALSYAGRVTLYKTWDFVTGGFVERQDARIAANAAGQLSDDDFFKATATDALGSAVAFGVAGQVGGFVAGRVGGYVGAAATGAAAGGSYDLTQQAAQNVTYALTDGEAGRNGVSLNELGNSTAFGAALGVGGKYLADYGSYNVRLNMGESEPGTVTLNSNPWPLRLEAPGSATLENIGRSDLGDLLGRGGNKDVYSYGDNQAVGVLRTGTNPQVISDEVDMLSKLRDAGIPTVNPQAITVDGTPGMLMDRFAQGSKDVVRLVDGKVRIVGDSPLLNQQSVADLQGIRDTMVKNQIKIDDLQFLISREGRVVVADPLNVQFNTAPSARNLRMIDLLMQTARKNGPF